MSDLPRHEIDIAIVGAGAAGIGAGASLAQGGASFVILEARGRLGGRSHTLAPPGSAPVDLGCGWLHSGDVNPWTRIAASHGMTVDRTPAPWQNDESALGMPVSDRQAFRAAAARFWDDLDRAGASAPDRPGSDFLPPGGRWNALIDATSTYINGIELDEVSTVDFARYADTEVNWRVREGYGALIAAHGASLPIVFGRPVHSIDHGGPLLAIETDGGTLRARRVLVTVPSTVLAEGGIRFHPDLPGKRNAAYNLPLGFAEKVFLTMDGAEAFPRDGRFFGRTDRAATGAYHLRPLGRPVIESYFGGRLARELQAAGEAAMTAFAIEEIAGVLGHAAAKRLRLLATSAWAGDPFSRGSYSRARVGHADDRAVLAAPVVDRLFFAGEACSTHDFSTAHGAYRTGVAAAEALLALRKA